MEIHLKFIGTLLIILAFIHVFFPKYFNWKTELSTVSLINRQMMYVHAFFIGLTLLLMGVLCLMFSKEIVSSRLGNVIAFGFFVFWSIRLIFQLFIYSRKLWRSKTFETTMHIFFTVLWSYLTFIFFMISVNLYQ